MKIPKPSIHTLLYQIKSETTIRWDMLPDHVCADIAAKLIGSDDVNFTHLCSARQVYRCKNEKIDSRQTPPFASAIIISHSFSQFQKLRFSRHGPPYPYRPQRMVEPARY